MTWEIPEFKTTAVVSGWAQQIKAQKNYVLIQVLLKYIGQQFSRENVRMVIDFADEPMEISVTEINSLFSPLFMWFHNKHLQ